MARVRSAAVTLGPEEPGYGEAALGEDHVLQHGQAGEQPGQPVGAGQAGVRAGLAAAALDPAAREGNLAGRRPHGAVDEVEQGGLARAVRAEEAGDAGGGEIEVHGVDRAQPAEGNTDVAQDEKVAA